MHLYEEFLELPTDSISYARAAILREDSARLSRLVELFSNHPDVDEFVKHGLFNQWTNGDFRTPEIRGEVEGLLRAYHAYLAGGKEDDLDVAVRTAWRDFDQARLRVLVGC